MKKNENVINFYAEKWNSSKGTGKLYNYIMFHPVEYAVVSYSIDNLHIYSFIC